MVYHWSPFLFVGIVMILHTIGYQGRRIFLAYQCSFKENIRDAWRWALMVTTFVVVIAGLGCWLTLKSFTAEEYLFGDNPSGATWTAIFYALSLLLIFCGSVTQLHRTILKCGSRIKVAQGLVASTLIDAVLALIIFFTIYLYYPRLLFGPYASGLY